MKKLSAKRSFCFIRHSSYFAGRLLNPGVPAFNHTGRPVCVLYEFKIINVKSNCYNSITPIIWPSLVFENTAIFGIWITNSNIIVVSFFIYTPKGNIIPLLQTTDILLYWTAENIRTKKEKMWLYERKYPRRLCVVFYLCCLGVPTHLLESSGVYKPDGDTCA